MDYKWRMFKQRFMLYLQALRLDTKLDARKIALLRTVTGPQETEVFNTFVYAEGEDEAKSDTVVGKFDEHCSPEKNETFERHLFRSCTQQPGESMHVFVTDLKLKARMCNFGQLHDSMIRDQLVFGIKDGKLSERLLRETDVKLAGAVKICQASELGLQQAKAFADKKDKDGAAIATVSGAAGRTHRKCGRRSSKKVRKLSAVKGVALDMQQINTQCMAKCVINVKDKITLLSNAFPKERKQR